MIDKACGFDREKYLASLAVLRCPDCKREKKVLPSDDDSKGTKTIVLVCPDCSKGGEFEEIEFLDAKGKGIKS